MFSRLLKLTCFIRFLKKPSESDSRIDFSSFRGSDIIDNSGVDLKRFNNILSIRGKKRTVERRDKRIENKKPSKEASKLWQRDCKRN